LWQLQIEIFWLFPQDIGMHEISRHNMLGYSAIFSRWMKVLAKGIFPLVMVGLGLFAFTWNSDAVFFDGQVYYSDGDCYARMTRVRELQAHPWAPIHRHDFENFPLGTHPHTTMPLDALIAALAVLMRPFSDQALALAGAWVSPLLGLATLGFLAVWGWRKRWHGATLALIAVSPIISHGFLLGRPDHQSLLMFLMTVALAAEIDMWSGKRHAGLLLWPAVWSGFAWGLALWVSLFEPLILLIAVLLMRLVARRLRISRTPLLVFLGILVLGLLVDGFPSAAFDPHFARWSQNIGELRHGSLPVLFGWAGWLVVLAPLGLFATFFRRGEAGSLLFGALALLLLGLTFWYLRWGYFLVIVLALGLPWLLPLARWRVLGWGIFLASLWPIAAEWDSTLYPDDESFRARAEAVADAVALRDAALPLKDLPRQGVIAPWWFSPAVVWWSGQPCVAGTSHQSLPGIVDTAEFFLSEDSGSDILLRRQVGYIIAYEPRRVISNAIQILGRPAPDEPLITRLYDHPRAVPFRMIRANRFFKTFSVMADLPGSAEK
jgi:hypothetical protein